ncbi:MAG: pyridoxamine 5'-phosphate oxidase family protein [Bacteroidales bacterium]|nr:pyridoxamine 5'-phosphate oxidase family protein [Bacteroidales bacterium]
MNTEGMQQVCNFIKSCEYYFLATVDGDQPCVRPFGTVNIFEDKLYIQTGYKKDVAKQILSNGKVEISCFNGSKWLRLKGVLVEDKRVEAKKAMLDAYPDLRRMYDENDDNTAVFFFTDAVATISSFVEPNVVIEF